MAYKKVLVTKDSDTRQLISDINDALAESNKLVLDMTGVTDFMPPFGVLSVILAWDYLCQISKSNGCNVRYRPPEPKSKVASYLKTINFFRYVPVSKGYLKKVSNYPYTVSNYPTDSEEPINLIQIVRISSDDDIYDAVDEACGKLKKMIGVSSEHKGQARDFAKAFMEVCDNVIGWSGEIENSGTGYIIAQRFNKRGSDKHGESTLAVVDWGIGMRGSLRRKYPIESDLEALRKSLEDGITCRINGEESGGRGLPRVAEIVRKWGGYLSINSGDVWLGVGKGVQHYREGLLSTPGVQLAIRLPF